MDAAHKYIFSDDSTSIACINKMDSTKVTCINVDRDISGVIAKHDGINVAFTGADDVAANI